jgi:hypothetical protein
VLVPVSSLAAVEDAWRPLAGAIEAIGYAGPTDRLAAVSELACRLRAHRLCPIERMQAPPFAWRQSGHTRLGSLRTDDATDAAAAPAFA